MINVLVVGSGAREHAIIKALSKSKYKPSLYCCAGSHNPGILSDCSDYWVGAIDSVPEVVRLAKKWCISLVVIGPEAPLAAGLADALWAIEIPVIGPKLKLAQIESSKTFARALMDKYNIPGAPQSKAFSDIEGISEYLESLGPNHYVIKANGLMGGKGVKVAGDHLHSYSEAIDYCIEIFEHNQTVLIEEKLIGQEFSLMCFTDGTEVVPMPLVQDNKRAFEGDLGPNTGGMGSFSDEQHSLPFLKPSDVLAAQEIMERTLDALQREVEDKYIGILYGGFIATKEGVSVIEFNARFGDPEALNVLSILESDLLMVFLAMIEGTLSHSIVSFKNQASVCKYVVPEGYPDAPEINVQININQVQNPNYLYLSGVNKEPAGLYTTGSRTAAYVGIADNLKDAQEIAEHEVSRIAGPLFHRKDIGTESLIEKRIRFMQELRGL